MIIIIITIIIKIIMMITMMISQQWCNSEYWQAQVEHFQFSVMRLREAAFHIVVIIIVKEVI